MCGIVGYLGKGEAYPALIKGLKRLEYRGYDSAGVALISNDGSLNVYKAKGKVADFGAFLLRQGYFGARRYCPYPLGYPWRAFSCECSPSLFF